VDLQEGLRITMDFFKEQFARLSVSRR